MRDSVRNQNLNSVWRGATAVLVFLTLASSLVAQDLSKHNWYFGNSTNGIRFNRGTNVGQSVTNQALPFSTGGAAVATDPATANLLFYSDGIRVYDGCHLPMPNGTGLLGQPGANQPVAIAPIPTQTNRYYLFTNSTNFTVGGSVSRSTIDLNQFGNAVFPAPALGVVDVAQKNIAIPGLSNRSEGMIVVPHANRVDFWLITHQNASQNYSATLIDAAATFPTTTTSGLGLPLSVANFSYHAPSGKIAVSPQSANVDAIILNFDNATGIFTFDRFLFNSATTATNSQSIYDIEWDPQGQYLYLSRHGDTGIPASVLQYDYLNPAITFAPVLSAPAFRSYGLQLAPDSAIYHLYQSVSGGPFLLGKFTNTDTVASQVINSQALFTSANFNSTQFSSFKPKDSVIMNVTFIAQGTCQNSPTSFFPTVTPNADSLRWDFGDGSGSGNWSPVYTYANAGSFNVTLNAFYRGQTQTTTLPVTINPFALQLTLVQDTTACRDEFPPPRGTSTPTQFSVKVNIQGGAAASIVWSNGDLGDTLTPDSAGYYYVVVTDASGCSAYAGVNVKEYGLQDQRFNVWYFGNKAGIDFNVQPPVALNNSIMNAPEGCAIVCDRNGDVIFYTDGDKVFDKTDTEIDNGIGGDPLASQSSIIVPVPGDETLYYIFTTQAINGTAPYELRYSLFDLKLNNGLGALQQKNVLLFSRSTERVTATQNWLLVHEYGNSTFRAYPISPDGIGQPIYSDIGSIHAFKFQQNGEGYMKIGPRNNVAVALSTPGTQNLVELFTLDNATGRLNNYRKIDLNEPNGQVYGIEFSPGGNKVFATVKGSPSPSQVFEYFLDSLDRPFFKQRIQQAAELGAIQVGPDGQIYVAVNGSGTLGAILANEDTTQLSGYNPSGFNLLAGTTSRLGLPNFVQQQGNAFSGPGFAFTGICFGDSTRFAGTATDAIDNFQWFFGDGGSSTEPDPVHLYAAPGLYTVSMRLTNRCNLDTTLVRQVRIFSPPPPPTIPGAAVLCTGSVTLDANTGNIPGFTYVWNSGDLTQTITLNQPSIASVIITDVNGCTSNGQTIVVDNRPQVDLGPDLTICEDNATPTLNAQNPGATYQWRIDGVNGSTIQTQAVDTTTPGVFTYEVTVTDPVTTCTVTDDKIFTINVSPAFTLTGTNPVGCGTATGTISLQLNTSLPPAGPYSYFLTGPNSFNQQGIDQLAPSTIGPIGGQIAGTFSGIVTDQISGCTLSSSFGLTDATFTASAVAQAPNCDPVTVRVTTVGGFTLPLQYTVTNNGTGQIIGPTASATAVFDIAPGLAAGTYTIGVRDNTGCIFNINNFAVTPAAPIVVSFTPDLCASPPTLTASGGTAYTWTTNVPGSIVSGANTATIQLLPGAGNVTYTVTATGAGCPSTQSTTVNVPGTIAASFTQSNACADQVILTAQPSGNFTYRWFRNGVQQGLGQSIALTTADNGVSYEVEVVSTLNGCVVRSAPTVVEVSGLITAAVTGTPACDDGNPFTLAATTNATGVAYAWFLNNVSISGATTAVINQTSAGIYKVEITKGTCTTPAQIQVIKAPLPRGGLPDRVIICNDPNNNDPSTASIDLNPGVFDSYNWFKNQVTLNYTLQILNADSEGLYEVDLTNSFGCVSRDQTEVLNDCVPKIVAPNAFRPTSAVGTNQNFFVYSFFITDNFQILIYNRWGELIFTSNDRNFKWNGGYDNNPGRPAPAGTYAYVVKYVSSFRPQRGIQEQRGGVALIR
ncbi:MAG: gliding motility-associated C-terminal domain-containing protein [Cyclobacteriaceae bacterium]|nr:gliding motility-associated C-terminal domain-containing protein [Cyclobacteriaceae bacterium]